MKRSLLLYLFLGMISFILDAQNQNTRNFFAQLKQGAYILSEGTMLKDKRKVEKFVSDFKAVNGEIESYKKTYDVSVTQSLDYEIGELRTVHALFSVMFIKNKTSSSAEIEFLVLYKNDSPSDDFEAIDIRRKKWMELCNNHNVKELVKQLYTKNTFYYNRGRLLQGTSAITTEYGYMSNPGYKLKLTPKHIVSVSDNITFEIGRCSGSYPLPYMLLWEKQSDGKWQILMDSNY